MIRYRAFLNSDPPRLAEIWRACAGRGGLAQPVSTAMIELLVLAKQYFDREGVILALDDERPVGFAHAGFGPNETETDIATDLGVTLLVLTVPHPQQDAIAEQLLARSEAYLRGRGAKVLYAGGIRPLNPFYWGLYGGSEPPGVPDSDRESQALFRARLSRNRSRRRAPSRPDRFPPRGGSAADANSPRDGYRSDHRSAGRVVVGRLRNESVRSDPIPPLRTAIPNPLHRPRSGAWNRSRRAAACAR